MKFGPDVLKIKHENNFLMLNIKRLCLIHISYLEIIKTP